MRGDGRSVAAICGETREIYFHPRIQLSEDEAVFVMAHELLHTGLRHVPRRQGRDPWLWNVACDYVINDWLIEMKIGAPPERLGYLHDPQLRGLSAEDVYDRITADLRWMRKLKKARTLNGGAPDMLDQGRPSGWWAGGGCDLDAFYRRALAEGLQLHQDRGRGFLPPGWSRRSRRCSSRRSPGTSPLGSGLISSFRRSSAGAAMRAPIGARARPRISRGRPG